MSKNVDFDLLLSRVNEIINDFQNEYEKLKSICELLKNNVDHYDWIGFYFVGNTEKNELVLGPFVGEPTEHVKIKFGDGICGQAAEMKDVFVVQDVSKETNYLSCSPKVKSEIVVPILKNGEIVGELDIDSHKIEPFTEKDKLFLEKVCEIVAKIV